MGAISTGSRGNFSTNARVARRKAHRLGNADNCIPPPRRSHSWWKSSVHGGNGVAGYGGRIPAEINSQRRGIHSVYLRRSRNRFRAIISATLQNDRAAPPFYLPPSRSTPRVPIKLHSVPSWLVSFFFRFLLLLLLLPLKHAPGTFFFSVLVPEDILCEFSSWNDSSLDRVRHLSRSDFSEERKFLICPILDVFNRANI